MVGGCLRAERRTLRSRGRRGLLEPLWCHDTRGDAGLLRARADTRPGTLRFGGRERLLSPRLPAVLPGGWNDRGHLRVLRARIRVTPARLRSFDSFSAIVYLRASVDVALVVHTVPARKRPTVSVNCVDCSTFPR